MDILSDNHLIFDKELREHALEKRQDLEQMVLGYLDIYLQKNKIRPVLITLHKATSGSETSL